MLLCSTLLYSDKLSQKSWKSLQWSGSCQNISKFSVFFFLFNAKEKENNKNLPQFLRVGLRYWLYCVDGMVLLPILFVYVHHLPITQKNEWEKLVTYPWLFFPDKVIALNRVECILEINNLVWVQKKKRLFSFIRDIHYVIFYTETCLKPDFCP